MQNRVSQNSIKLNENMAKNKSLRNKIDSIRKERVVYDKIYRDLEYDYMQAKDEFIKTMQIQIFSQDEKEETLAQLNLIKSEAKKLDGFFDQEWNKMLQLIANDINIDDFYQKYKEKEDKKRAYDTSID